MSLPALTIRRAIDAYRVRCWHTGLRCMCGCMCRIPWDMIRAIGGYETYCKSFKGCLVSPDILQELLDAPDMDLASFRNLLIKNQTYYRRHVNSIRVKVEAWGDAYTATLLGMRRLTTEYRRIHGSLRQEAWNMYMSYKLNESYPKTAAILSKWLQGIPPQHAWVPVFTKYATLHNPALRTMLVHPLYKKVSMATAAAYAYRQTPLIRVVRTGQLAKQIRDYQWALTTFWCHHVRAKLRAWRSSFCLRTSIPFSATEELDRMLVRNPALVPHAAYTLSTAIHRQQEVFLKQTISYGRTSQQWQDRGLTQWITFLAASKTVNAARALRKIWRTSSHSNGLWYFTFVHLLLDAPVSHNRLLISILHRSTPFQCTQQMSEFFWKVMRSPLQRPAVIAKLLYISNLRNAWQASGHRSFHELLWSPAILTNIRHPCVSKEIAQYLSTPMVLRLADMQRRDIIQHVLWESPAVQKQYNYLQSTYKARRGRFWDCVPARWKAKQLRRQLRKQQMLSMPALRTLAIRSSYLWRKLQATACPICMEERRGRMVPLHGEMRHGICRECRDTIVGTTNRCPLCRVSLSYKTPSEEVFYEDEWYDDDQMYHYD